MRLVHLLLFIPLATPAAAEITLYDWSDAACARWDIPDTPARLWRDDAGVVLLAGSERSRVSAGPALDALTRDCEVLHEGRRDPDPQAHDGRVWVHSTWAHEDGRVEALGHVEYHGHETGLCAADAYLACWRNSIVPLVRQNDGTFVRDGEVPAAALPYSYDPGQTRRTGYFNPSNILRKGDHLYAFVFSEAHGAQRRGACLLRRRVEGRAWTAWDGTDFDARLSGLAAPVRGDTCAPVAGVRSTLSSVVHDGLGGFVAVTARAVDGVSGIWIQRSDDLLRWDAPELLAALPLLWRRDCAAPAVYAYPSLVAPGSRSRNFDTIEGEVWLSAVRMPLAPDCSVGPERDLVAWRLNRQTDGGLALAEPAP
jgi:hypothetical protein